VSLEEKVEGAPLFQSEAKEVILFEDRAEVVRSARVQLQVGQNSIRIAGLGPFSDERSLEISLGDPKQRLLSAQLKHEVEWLIQEEREQPPEIALEEAQLRKAELELNHRRLGRRRSQLSKLMKNWVRSLAQLKPGEGGEQSWRLAFTRLSAAYRSAQEDWLKEEEALKEAQEVQTLVQERARRQRQREPVIRAFVWLQIEAEREQSLEVQLRYRTPAALWRPEHRAQLTSDSEEPSRGVLQLLSWACAWQFTGESWENVKLSFSTARPARAAKAPLLQDDLLLSRLKTQEERKQIQVELRDEEVQKTGRRPGHQIEEMPGVDDGGEPLLFKGLGLSNLPSNGEPVRLELEYRSLDASISRILMAERSPVAHYRARATLKGKHPLLAGPVKIVREGALLGTARIGFVSPGEVLELGFGADDALRVTRELICKEKRAAVTGSQQRSYQIKLLLSNMSGEVRSLEVLERIPVSEVEAVEIEFKPQDPWNFQAEDGFLNQSLELGARCTEILNFEYEIRARSKVRLPLL